METDLIKTIEDSDYSDNVKSTFQQLKNTYHYTLRVSMILQVIKLFLSSKEFMLLDERNSNNALFESYLIDKYIDWQHKKSVNFSEIYRKLLEVYSFSSTEKLLLETSNIEEKLWAFFIALSKDSI